MNFRRRSTTTRLECYDVDATAAVEVSFVVFTFLDKIIFLFLWLHIVKVGVYMDARPELRCDS